MGNVGKIIVCTLSAVIIFSTFICKNACARDIKPDFDPWRNNIERGWINLSIYGAGAFPETFKNINGIELLQGSFYGGRFTYDATPYIAVGIDFGRLKLGVDFISAVVGGEPTQASDAGEINASTLMGVLVLKAPIEMSDNRLVPYVLVGLGAIFTEFDEGFNLEIENATIKDYTTFVMKSGLGFDYYVTEKAALFIEGSFLWADYDPIVNIVDLGTGTLDKTINALLFGGGLKFSF